MSSSANNSKTVHLILSTTALLHAGNYTVSKLIMPEFLSPFSLVILRLVIAGSLFWIFSCFLPQSKFSFREHKTLIYCAFAGSSANILLFFWGLNLTNASNGSLIMTITPIFVLILSALVLKEKLNTRKWIGILLGFSGAILLGKNTFSSSGTETLIGDLMIFINAFLYGIYLVLVKPLAQKHHPIVLFKWISLYGLLFLSPFCFNDFIGENWEALPNHIWLLILYVCVAATFFTYLLNAYALKFTNASLVGIYIYVQPIVATILAISIGQENFDLSKLFIAVYIFFGVYLVSSKPVGN